MSTASKGPRCTTRSFARRIGLRASCQAVVHRNSHNYEKRVRRPAEWGLLILQALTSVIPACLGVIAGAVPYLGPVQAGIIGMNSIIVVLLMVMYFRIEQGLRRPYSP